MFKKKNGIFAITLAMAAMCLTGCGAEASAGSTASSSSSNNASNDTLSVVCTIFPEYDWVKEILGDNAGNVKVTYLLDNGVDLHSYQPTADDIMKISKKKVKKTRKSNMTNTFGSHLKMQR